jgi:hypothetical protein
MHRGDGACATFHRKVGHDWQELGAILVSELGGRWPDIRRYLDRDAYFSINSTYEQKTRQRISTITGLPIYSRKSADLRWLNAVAVDLDPGHDDRQFAFESLVGPFVRRLDLSGLPQPNFVVSSGRGMWVLWLIREHSDASKPVRAFADKREICQRVNQALARQFADLGADVTATDPARVMRVPNSINSNAAPEKSVVRFYCWSNSVHTLPELAALLGVVAHKQRLPGERGGHKDEAKVRAGLMRWRAPLEGLRNLWEMRGQFTKGTRHDAVWVYALLLRKNRFSDTEIFRQCMRLAESCRPILTAEHVKRCVSSGTKASLRPFHRSLSNAAIARLLRITGEERVALPKWFKPVRERKSTQLASRRMVMVRALQLAGKWNSDRHSWISARDMACLLAEKHGIRISHVTVLRDYGFLYQQHFRRAPSASVRHHFSGLENPGDVVCTGKRLPSLDTGGVQHCSLGSETNPLNENWPQREQPDSPRLTAKRCRASHQHRSGRVLAGRELRGRR